jgi:hypothetical protein
MRKTGTTFVLLGLTLFFSYAEDSGDVLKRTFSAPLFLGNGKLSDNIKPESLDLIAAGGNEIFDLSKRGNKERKFEQDSEIVALPILRLAEALGYVEVGGKKVLDLSYHSLFLYVLRLEKEGKFTDEKSKKVLEEMKRVNAIKVISPESGEIAKEAVEALCEASEIVIESAEAERLRPILEEMVSTSTGEQRIKSLIIVKLLIDNGIGDIGFSSFRNQKIKISFGDESIYKYRFELTLMDGKEDLFYVKNDPDASAEEEERNSGSVPAALLHELCHAYHGVLGLYGLTGVENSFRAALVADPSIRNAAIPLLEENTFAAMKRKIIDNKLSVGNGNGVRLDKIITEDKFYQFLEANDFFGNPLLKVKHGADRNVDSEVEDFLIYLVCNCFGYWGNGEEMLAILGVAPVKLPNGETWNILDRQNENTERIRAYDVYRILHCGVTSSGRSSDKLNLKDPAFLKIFSEAQKEAGTKLYRSRQDMKPTPDNVYEEIQAEKRFGDLIGKDEINKSVKAWGELRVRLRGIDEKDYVKEVIDDICEYAERKGIRISDESFRACWKACSLTKNVLRNYLQGREKEEALEIMEKSVRELRICKDDVGYILELAAGYGDPANVANGLRDEYEDAVIKHSVTVNRKFLRDEEANERYLSPEFGNYIKKFNVVVTAPLAKLKKAVKWHHTTAVEVLREYCTEKVVGFDFDSFMKDIKEEKERKNLDGIPPAY